MDTARRQFLSQSILSAAALTLPFAACARQTPAATAAPATPVAAPAGKLLMRTIPASGEAIPAIGVGTSGSYEVAIGSPEYAALKDVLRVFFAAGGSVIDTSPNYSNAEDVVGALLADGGLRAKCFLATKLAADSREALEAQWADSMRRLRTDKVELLQVHNLRNLAQALPYARELKAAGKTKYVGLTHFRDSAHAELADLMRKEKPDFVQVNYSVSTPAAARSVFPLAKDLGIAVIVNLSQRQARFDHPGVVLRHERLLLANRAVEPHPATHALDLAPYEARVYRVGKM